ncbi:MAG: tetratricopeptide repeat protein [Bacteroidales bacterium]
MKLLLIVFIIVLPLLAPAQRQDDSSANERLANQYMREGDYEKAVALFEELFNENPSPVIYNNYLYSLLELEEFRSAVNLVEQQIEKNPGNARYQVDLGYVYDRSGGTRRMRRQFDQLIKNIHPHPPSVNDLANAFIFRDYFDQALETYMKGRDILGVSNPFNLQIASIYSRQGEYDKMMDEYVDLLVIDDSFIENVQGLLQDEINDDPEFIKSNALRRALLERSQRNPSKTIFAEMLLWLSIQQKDFRMALRQSKILDRRMDQEGQLVLEVARLSALNNQFDTSLEGFEYIVSMGDINPFYLDARIGLLNVKYMQATSDYNIDYDLLREVEDEYERIIEEIGIGARTVTLIRNLANLKAFYLNNIEEAADLLRNVIDMQNISNRVKAECRIELADILLLKGQMWDAHLLYAQVDKTFRDDPLAHEARYKNARLSFYMGEFAWAKAQLDVIKSATSKLIANDALSLSLLIQDNLEEDGTSIPLEMFARAEMHVFMNNFDQALNVLDSLSEMFPENNIQQNVFMTKARINIRTGKHDEANDLLAKITELYPDGLLASEALFERAQLYENIFNDQQEAMRLYQALITDYPGSVFTITARNRFRYLRGDLIN